MKNLRLPFVALLPIVGALLSTSGSAFQDEQARVLGYLQSLSSQSVSQSEKDVMVELVRTYFESPDALSKQEKEQAQSLVQATLVLLESKGGPDLSVFSVATKKRQESEPKRSYSFKLIGMSGVVVAKVDGQPRNLLELKNRAGGKTPQQRAALVAEKLEKLESKRRDWPSSLRVGKVNGEWVVASRYSPDGFLVTADKELARLWGKQPQVAARLQLNKVKQGVYLERMRAVGVDDEGERRLDSMSLRLEANELAETDKGAAVKKFQAAINSDPSYYLPYIELVQLLRSMGRTNDANTVLNVALQQDSIEPEFRAQIEALRKN